MYQDGEKFFFKGVEYPLKRVIFADKSSLRLEDTGPFTYRTAHQEQKERLLRHGTRELFMKRYAYCFPSGLKS